MGLGFYGFMDLDLKLNFHGFVGMSFGFQTQTQTHARNPIFFEFSCTIEIYKLNILLKY
jgi:hypothetical protein